MHSEELKQPPQKLIDFNNDLKALCDKYQYELVPVIRYEPDGAYPVIVVKDISPKEQAAKSPEAPEDANPTPEAPQPEQPAQPQEQPAPEPTPETPVDTPSAA